jgi:hypothetical protein
MRIASPQRPALRRPFSIRPDKNARLTVEGEEAERLADRRDCATHATAPEAAGLRRAASSHEA